MNTKLEPIAYLVSIVCLSATYAGLGYTECQTYEAQGLEALESHSYKKAELFFKARLHTAEKLGYCQETVIDSLNKLAQLYSSSGNLEAAESMYERALTLAEANSNRSSCEIATNLTNLALIYELSGRYEEAGSLYERALAMMEKELGGNNPILVNQLNHLASLYERQGKYSEADAMYKRTISISEMRLGANSQNFATALKNHEELNHKHINKEKSYEISNLP